MAPVMMKIELLYYFFIKKNFGKHGNITHEILFAKEYILL